MNPHIRRFLLQDLAIIVLSVIVAVMLARTDVLIKLLTSTKELELIGSFVAGIFFTSVFTTAPAIVTLGEIAKTNSLILTAIFGGLGAVIGDLIIFSFVKDRLAEHLSEVFKHQHWSKQIKTLIRLKYFRWFTFFIGGLIIASPFPDELGISLLGFSKMRSLIFMLVSFIFNSIGILLIGLVARAL